MENSAVSLGSGVGAATAPAAPALPRAPSSKAAPPDLFPSTAAQAVTDAQFLARQMTSQADGGARETYARFSVDPDTHEVRVDIIDAARRQVIRTIPGDDLRRMARDFRASNGFVLDSTA